MRSIPLPRACRSSLGRAGRSVALLLAAFTFAMSTAMADEPSAPEAPPQADEDAISQARGLTRQGLEHYEAARYPEAIAAFEAAYARLPLPLLLYNLGQAHRLAGDCRSAIRYYERFAETRPTGSVAEFVRNRLRELGDCSNDETPSPPVDATQPAASSAPLTRRGAGKRPTFEATPSPAAPNAALTSDERSRLLPTILSGGAVVLLGAGSYFTWQSHEASSNVSRRFEGTGGTWDGSGVAAERRGKLYEAASIATLAASALLGGVSVWLWTFE